MLLKWLDPTLLSLFPVIPWHGLVVTTGRLDGNTSFWRMSVVQMCTEVPSHTHVASNPWAWLRNRERQQRKGHNVSRITAIIKSENSQKHCYKSVNINWGEDLHNLMVFSACWLVSYVSGHIHWAPQVYFFLSNWYKESEVTISTVSKMVVPLRQISISKAVFIEIVC